MRKLAFFLILVLLLVSVMVPVTQAQSPCGATYTVQRGDNLYRIAQRCGVTIEALMAANPSIPNRDTVSVGQVLVIPGAVPTPAPAGPCGATYIVQRGDSLSSISRRCGVSLFALIAANAGIWNRNLIYPGQQIVIPQAGGSPISRQTFIYLIAVGDNGRSGTKIGCDDSLVPVTVNIGNTSAVLTETLRYMLSLRDQYYGQSGLYNALYNSRLTVDRVTIQNGLASIYLSGQLSLAGVCDNPRVDAQIRYIALQFRTVTSVAIYLNGQPLQNFLSGQ